MKAWAAALAVCTLLQKCIMALPLDKSRQKVLDLIGNQLRVSKAVFGKGNEPKKKQRPGPGTLHFLIMASDGFPLLKYWAHFFSAAPLGQASVWFHCTDLHACSPDIQEFQKALPFTRVAIVPTAHSEYCLDLVSPMAQLANYALRASRSRRDKFTFASASALPVKPFREMQSMMFADGDSDICLHKGIQESKPFMADGARWHLLRGTQWVTLNREHARRFGRRWARSPRLHYNRSVTLLVKEAGTGDKDLWLHNITCDAIEKPQREDEFKRTFCQGCGPTDSVAVFATTIGAIPHEQLPEDGQATSVMNFTGPGWKPACRTLATFSEMPEHLLESPTARTLLRGAAEVESMDMQSWEYGEKHLISNILNDPTTVVHGHDKSESHGSHPWTFDALSKKSFVRLRCSKMYFARKFADTIDLPFFEEVLNEKDPDSACTSLKFDEDGGGMSPPSPTAANASTSPTASTLPTSGGTPPTSGGLPSDHSWHSQPNDRTSPTASSQLVDRVSHSVRAARKAIINYTGVMSDAEKALAHAITSEWARYRPGSGS